MTGSEDPRPAELARDPLADVATLLAAVERCSPSLAPPARTLAALADARALDAPVRLDGRIFAREAMEELADAANYLVWLRRERARAGAGSAELAILDTAIVGVVGAWDKVARVPWSPTELDCRTSGETR